MIHAISSQFTFPQLVSTFVSREKVDKIALIARAALTQLVLAWTVNMGAKIFLGTLFTPPVVNATLLAISAILLTLTVIKIAHHCLTQSGATTAIHAWAEYLSGYAARSAICIALTPKLNHCIHEWGHGVAAMMTYIKANPKVRFDATGGGATYAVSYGLTRFGTILGEHSALIFVTAAGLIAPALLAMAEFAAAYGLSEKIPFASDLLIAHGLSQLAEPLVYGMNNFPTYRGDMQNDFLKLWDLGIHPAIPIALIIALPLAQGCVLWYMSQKANRDGPATA